MVFSKFSLDKEHKTIYQNRRKEVKKLTNKFMEMILKEKISDKEIFLIINELPLKRMETTQQIRAFLMSLAFEISGGKDFRKLAPAYACIELLVASMYYENRIFDHKGGKRDLSTIKKDIMAGYSCRDLSERVLLYLQENFSLKKIVQCRNLLNEIDFIFQLGELQDVFQNIYSRRKKDSFENQVEFCLKRTYRINASMVEKAMKMASMLATNDKKKREVMGEFGKYYAMAGQLLNDVIDFIPSIYGHTTSEKVKSDTYRDIMNEKMTLPIIYCLNFGTKKEIEMIKKILKKGMKSNEKKDLIPLTDILIKNGSLAFGKKLADYYFKKAKQILRENFNKDKRRLLSMSTQVFWNNKYYYSLTKIDKDWRTKELNSDSIDLKPILESI